MSCLGQVLLSIQTTKELLYFNKTELCRFEYLVSPPGSYFNACAGEGCEPPPSAEAPGVSVLSSETCGGLTAL